MPQLPTISETAPLVQKGKISPRRLVEECLERIEQFDDKIRAWVEIDAQDALRQADKKGREIAAGRYRGPLHGVPVGIKDIIDVAGFPTKAGSPLRSTMPAVETDAPLVASLRKAGAIILGKTVTVEFACFDPSPTRNPWDVELNHTPGGSSSGSAAALAMGMCFASIGTQTGGSLVRPSSYCGTATLKPTFGRLTREGIFPVSEHFDHPGPMARSVEDLHFLYQCFLGEKFSPLKPAAKPPRFGLLKNIIKKSDDAVGTVFQGVIRRLKKAGAAMAEMSVPSEFDDVPTHHRRIMAVEAASVHRKNFPAQRKRYGAKISSLLNEAQSILGIDYFESLLWQKRWATLVNGLFDEVDFLLMPSTETTAPATLETTGTPLFQAPWSVSGVPVVSMPCGLASDGMPVGFQIIGPRCEEKKLLRAARWCEKAIGFNALPPWLI